MVTKEELSKLLDYSEANWLDWKASFPSGLLKGKTGLDWDKGRGTLLKDLIAIANGEGRPCGYLIYGVKDMGSSRDIVGISNSWDDAMFQTWAGNTFDPIPNFHYSEVQWDSTNKLGIIQIERSPNYPHVAVTNVGGIIFEGQVWFRQGTKNTIARRSDLRMMFLGEEAFKITKLDDPVFQEIEAFYKQQGLEPICRPLANKDSYLARGYQLAYYPKSRKEVWVGHHRGEYEQILMLKPH
jgi:hypothetical protein